MEVDYKAVLTDLIAKRDAAQRELDKANKAIAAIQDYIRSEPQARLPGLEYAGMTIVQAAKAFLRKGQGAPKTSPQIAEALTDGGYEFGTDTPANTITSILTRELEKEGTELYRPGRGLWSVRQL